MSDTDGGRNVHYPENVTLGGILYFAVAPTLCYQARRAGRVGRRVVSHGCRARWWAWRRSGTAVGVVGGTAASHGGRRVRRPGMAVRKSRQVRPSAASDESSDESHSAHQVAFPRSPRVLYTYLLSLIVRLVLGVLIVPAFVTQVRLLTALSPHA